MSLDIKKIIDGIKQDDRFESRMRFLEDGPHARETKNIRDVIKKAVENIESEVKSFVIFGEPQSGKTEMMIALTAKLLDLEKSRFIIILVNDNVELLNQNLGRFVSAQLNPTPLEFSRILDPNININNGQWVIFCKKNSKNLQKLLDKLKKYPCKTIIDDEADYASPNSKINKNEKNAINSLISELLGDDGLYIGVTATPARLDLNNTFNNDNTKWIYFEPHSAYTGQQSFFPADKSQENLVYKLNILPDIGDSPDRLEKAIMNFLMNVAFLNIFKNKNEINYSMLIHTSGKTADMSVDYHVVQKLIEELKIQNLDDQKFKRIIQKLEKECEKAHPGCENEILSYILKKIGASNIIIMNSETDRNTVDYSLGTDPRTPFSFVIGGNVVSRGVTFNNLLSMFFTRDSKHKIQQDTYIQRARMFGSRNAYINYFELSIPEELFNKWHQCFVFHALSLQAIKNGQKPPVWFEGGKISAVSRNSIDKSNIDLQTGEMTTSLIKDQNITDKLKDIVESDISSLEKLEKISNEIGDDVMPKYMIEFIKSTSEFGSESIGWVPKSRPVREDESSDYYKELTRKRGIFGGTEIIAIKKEKPKAVHFFLLIHNNLGFSRLVYKHEGRITTIKHKR